MMIVSQASLDGIYAKLTFSSSCTNLWQKLSPFSTAVVLATMIFNCFKA